MRRYLIAGNWKMNKTVSESVELARGLVERLKDVDDRDILICPPFTSLYPVYQVIRGTNIKLGAQDVFYEDSGAYTGEISPIMLKDVGCEYVIIGHSERRHVIGETDEVINKKVRNTLKNGLRVILCVGELLEEREQGKTLDVVRGQTVNGLSGVSKEDIKNVVIAYEPVWAIGTGKTAKPEDAQEVQEFIRKIISEMYSKEIADGFIIQYGGSVKANNIDDLMAMPDIDGALVGGASLNLDEFVRIVKFVKK
ncbi:MAG: triose-phosphate isomerase [Spirochaetia bacterium]|nr:triose-phosphate isomerase [Spirochaetota bacterium]MCX8096265.1 triose-phosphate isomerase [Spirochaetota bacterium]MDW8112125.1 triose-phosphate isomerase [Spirochaetia bacterium]